MSTEIPEMAQQKVDYWGTDESVRHFLPDGEQYLDLKVMNEGDRKRYESSTSQDVTFGQDRNARIRMDTARDRHQLLKTCIKDWKLYKSGELINFSRGNLDKWLEVAPPKVIDDIAHAARLANPWMSEEMDVETIDKEMERLEDLRKQVISREAGEGVSATK